MFFFLTCIFVIIFFCKMNIFSEIFVSHVCCILQFTSFVLNLSGWTFSIQISRSHFNFEAWHSYDDNPSSQIKGMFWGKCKQTADIFSFHEFFGLDYFFPFSYKKGTVESPWASVPLGFQPLGGPFGFQVMVQNQSILLFFSPYNQWPIFLYLKYFAVAYKNEKLVQWVIICESFSEPLC